MLLSSPSSTLIVLVSPHTPFFCHVMFPPCDVATHLCNLNFLIAATAVHGLRSTCPETGVVQELYRFETCWTDS